jgi:hypothetical protein
MTIFYTVSVRMNSTYMYCSYESYVYMFWPKCKKIYYFISKKHIALSFTLHHAVLDPKWLTLLPPPPTVFFALQYEWCTPVCLTLYRICTALQSNYCTLHYILKIMGQVNKKCFRSELNLVRCPVVSRHETLDF